eukprot:scaffold6270_cov98-Isochrysis_galbana.AAC.2
MGTDGRVQAPLLGAGGFLLAVSRPRRLRAHKGGARKLSEADMRRPGPEAVAGARRTRPLPLQSTLAQRRSGGGAPRTPCVRRSGTAKRRSQGGRSR